MLGGTFLQERGLLSGCCVLASHCGGWSSCRLEGLQPSVAVAPGSKHRFNSCGAYPYLLCGIFWTRDQKTGVPYIARQICNHWTPREAGVQPPLMKGPEHQQKEAWEPVSSSPWVWWIPSNLPFSGRGLAHPSRELGWRHTRPAGPPVVGCQARG